MLGKNTILKAIHNEQLVLLEYQKVWMLGKNTILKAIHNITDAESVEEAGVNAG